jgi:protein LSM14
VPPSLDNVYEYIVFRGSDVKDLRIEEGPKESNPSKPSVPDDPAILGVSSNFIGRLLMSCLPQLK